MESTFGSSLQFSVFPSQSNMNMSRTEKIDDKLGQKDKLCYTLETFQEAVLGKYTLQLQFFQH